MTTRRMLIAGNWKMNKTVLETAAFAAELAGRLGQEKSAGDRASADGQGGSEPEALICPPFPALSEAGRVLAPLGVAVGAQTMHEQDSGAFTGEVSAPMLAELGCQYVILGHSERRQFFAETDAAVARKAVAALRAGLRPIVCVGETLEEREAGLTAAVIDRQMGSVLTALTAPGTGNAPVGDSTKDQPLTGLPAELSRAELVIAYEPIWAIGTGRSSSAADAQEVCGRIRDLTRSELGAESADRVRILYGGSVKPDNLATYVAEPDIDGALVGGASLSAASFAALLTAAREA